MALECQWHFIGTKQEKMKDGEKKLPDGFCQFIPDLLAVQQVLAQLKGFFFSIFGLVWNKLGSERAEKLASVLIFKFGF